ncbi:MAG: hypothetical protein ACE5IL_09370 [Myxococcota bacterium]
MALEAPIDPSTPSPGLDSLWRYPLVEALFKRRTRRVALGTEVPGGPTAYRSSSPPVPLGELEEAILVQAATGLTGFNLSDLPFCDGEGRDAGGNTMIQFSGRSWASPCGSHDTELFFWNDDGTYVMKLHDVLPERMQEFASADDRSRILSLHRKHAVKLFDGRPQYPHTYPTMLPFNIPTSDVPGSTIFLPIADTTFELINVLLLMCGWPDGGVTVVDPENGNRPAGCERWIREGLLDRLNTAPLSYFGNVSLIESGFIIQNLLLAIQAMGLGGWPHAHPVAPVLLGGTPLAKGLGFRFMTGTGGSSAGMPAPVGLDGVLEPYCPPYYPNMDAAVDAVVEGKFGEGGLYDPKGADRGPFLHHGEVVAEVPRYSDALVQCVKDICNYIYDTYGRFPSHVDPIVTSGTWVQAHHLDLEFYDRFYKEGAYTETQRDHMRLWHAGETA